MAQACGIDPLEFRLKNYAEIGADDGKAVFLESPARMLRQRRGGVRLVEAAAKAAPDARRARLPGRLGHGYRNLPRTDVRRPGARDNPARRHGRHGDRRARHGPGRVDRACPDRGRRARARSGSGRVQVGHLRPAGRRHRRRLSPYRDRGLALHDAGAAVIAKLAEIATSDRRSPLFGAGNAGVVARGGRLFRRDDESRSESYADILGRAGLAEIEHAAMARWILPPRPPTRCARTARSLPRSRSIPISARSASPA